MLQAAAAAGVSAAGGEALLGGVLPTPAAPLLIARYGLDLAVVLSASHNPFQDNGIKFFGGDGYKLSDETELAIERAAAGRAAGAPRRSGACASCAAPARTTCASCTTRFSELDLAGLDVLLDCANGATAQIAPRDLQAPGCEGHRAGRCARRAQHQRRLRLDTRRGARRARAGRRARDRICL